MKRFEDGFLLGCGCMAVLIIALYLAAFLGGMI